jgi:hypothetical protein
LPFVPGKSSLQLLKRGGVKDILKWKWLRGVRTTLAEYGNPTIATNYQLCLYDASGLRVEATIPAGGTCGTKACWRQNGVKGFKYKDAELAPDGAQQLSLKEGAVGKAQIQLAGRGANLHLPPDLTALVEPITVQIQQSDGTCWGAVYSAPARTSTPVKLSDRAD